MLPVRRCLYTFHISNDIHRLSNAVRCKGSSTKQTLPHTSDSVTEYKLKPDRLFDFDAKSLAARGYLRSQKPYDPPADVEDRIIKIVQANGITDDVNTLQPEIKYAVLNECTLSFGHTVPNSLLHKVNRIGEIISFYKTPVSSSVPLDQMKNIDLPKNLHVLYNYVRFHPETDTKFGGVSAFPESSTAMSNVKDKKRYPGYNAKKKLYSY